MRIALVDDDKNFAEEMRAFAQRYALETGKPMEIVHFLDGLAFLENYRPGFHLVFLDIEMPYMSGIEVAKRLREKDEVVALIFTTNLSQYAINGYEVNAIDYVVKPLSYYIFQSKIAKAEKHCEKYAEYDFCVSTRGGIERLQTSSIYYIEVMNHSIFIHSQKGIVEMTGSLTKVENELKDHSFTRCNYCYLVNLRYVEGVYDGFVKIAGESLPISRSRKKGFLEELLSYRGNL